MKHICNGFMFSLWLFGNALKWLMIVVSAPVWLPIFAVIIADDYEWDDFFPEDKP